MPTETISLGSKRGREAISNFMSKIESISREHNKKKMKMYTIDENMPFTSVL